MPKFELILLKKCASLSADLVVPFVDKMAKFVNKRFLPNCFLYIDYKRALVIVFSQDHCVGCLRSSIIVDFETFCFIRCESKLASYWRRLRACRDESDSTAVSRCDFSSNSNARCDE